MSKSNAICLFSSPLATPTATWRSRGINVSNRSISAFRCFALANARLIQFHGRCDGSEKLDPRNWLRQDIDCTLLDCRHRIPNTCVARFGIAGHTASMGSPLPFTHRDIRRVHVHRALPCGGRRLLESRAPSFDRQSYRGDSREETGKTDRQFNGGKPHCNVLRMNYLARRTGSAPFFQRVLVIEKGHAKSD